MSTQSGTAGLRQQVSGSEENYSAAADRTPAALQQSGNGSTFQRCLWFTSRGQSWRTHSCRLQVSHSKVISVFTFLRFVVQFLFLWSSNFITEDMLFSEYALISLYMWIIAVSCFKMDQVKPPLLLRRTADHRQSPFGAMAALYRQGNQRRANLLKWQPIPSMAVRIWHLPY